MRQSTERLSIFYVWAPSLLTVSSMPVRGMAVWVFQISAIIWICALQAALHLLQSPDLLLRELVCIVELEQRLIIFAAQLGLDWPTDFPAIAKKKTLWKAGVMREWADLPLQGVGVSHFWNEPVGNS